MAMAWSQFMALLSAMRAIQAEEDLRALNVATVAANPGQKGEAVKRYSTRLQRDLGKDAKAKQSTVLLPGMPGVRVTDSDLRTDREQRRAEWLAKHKHSKQDND